MKTTLTTIALPALAAFTLSAAVPLRWTVETSRVQPAVFDAVRGETVTLEAALQSYGKAVSTALEGEWKVYWQTNGMADAWWSAPASASPSNLVTAVFTPAMDPGAPAVNGFIGSPGSNYRAAFTIRFRHGPGAVPNQIAKPIPVLDLANTTVINAPWPTDETIAEEIERIIDEKEIAAGLNEQQVRGVVTDTVDKAYVEALGIKGGVKESENDPGWAERAEYAGYADYAGTAYTANDADFALISIFLENENNSEYYDYEGIKGIDDAAKSANAWAQNVYRYMTANTNAWFAGTNYVTTAQQAAARHKFAFEDDMDLSTVPCSMALWEVRDAERVCVWDQRDWDAWYWAFKHRQLLGEIDPKIAAKADKAWSKHTATGIDNPVEDTVWIDTPKVVLSAGYAWQRNQSTRGSFFTLVNRGGITTIGDSRNGSYFEIKDDEGRSIFRISKTDSYMADADAASVRVEDGVTLVVDYPGTVQPVAYCCADIAAADFREESDLDCPATVVWSRSGGAYTVRATPKAPDGKLFLFAKVKVEGLTKNEFAAPVEFTKIVIGGVTYTVGTATVCGHTVLTLTR